MATGIEMMLKGAGINIKKITEDFTALKDGVLETLKRIDAKLERIEKTQEEIIAWQTQQSNKPQPQPLQVQPQPAPLMTRPANPA